MLRVLVRQALYICCILATSLTRFPCVQDASDEFNAIHSSKAKVMLDDYLLGELTTDGVPPAGANLRV